MVHCFQSTIKPLTILFKSQARCSDSWVGYSAKISLQSLGLPWNCFMVYIIIIWCALHGTQAVFYGSVGKSFRKSSWQCFFVGSNNVTEVIKFWVSDVCLGTWTQRFEYLYNNTTQCAVYPARLTAKVAFICVHWKHSVPLCWQQQKHQYFSSLLISSCLRPRAVQAHVNLWYTFHQQVPPDSDLFICPNLSHQWTELDGSLSQQEYKDNMQQTTWQVIWPPKGVSHPEYLPFSVNSCRFCFCFASGFVFILRIQFNEASDYSRQDISYWMLE
jgi:hypothetical protein